MHPLYLRIKYETLKNDETYYLKLSPKFLIACHCEEDFSLTQQSPQELEIASGFAFATT